MKVISLHPGTGFFGIATAKKLGVRPARNHAKRRVREAIRLNIELAEPNLDYIVVTQVAAAGATFEFLQAEIRRQLQESKGRWVEELASS